MHKMHTEQYHIGCHYFLSFLHNQAPGKIRKNGEKNVNNKKDISYL